LSALGQAICCQLQDGADNIFFVRFNPNPMKGDGAGQLKLMERCRGLASLVARRIMSAAAAAAAAAAESAAAPALPPPAVPAKVTICYCWYPNGLQHKHPKACSSRSRAQQLLRSLGGRWRS
jgi:hypothetical protein